MMQWVLFGAHGWSGVWEHKVCLLCASVWGQCPDIGVCGGLGGGFWTAVGGSELRPHREGVGCGAQAEAEPWAGEPRASPAAPVGLPALWDGRWQEAGESGACTSRRCGGCGARERERGSCTAVRSVSLPWGTCAGMCDLGSVLGRGEGLACALGEVGATLWLERAEARGGCVVYELRWRAGWGQGTLLRTVCVLGSLCIAACLWGTAGGVCMRTRPGLPACCSVWGC